VHVVLKDDPVVDEVIAAARSGLDAQTIIVDHSTTQPKLTAERSARLNREGVKYLHCPVFIGPPAARQAKGTILVAGPKNLYERVREPLSKMAERVEYFGERPDLAAVFQLCGNAFIVGINAVIADSFAVAKGARVPAEDVLRVLEFFNTSAIVSGRGQHMVARQFTPTFELTMARKDIRLMLETADKEPLSVLPCIASRMDALIKEGHGDDDLAILAVNSVS